ncbi:hypothetical protein JCM3765_007167 [Sporobolomyces pararoseus]
MFVELPSDEKGKNFDRLLKEVQNLLNAKGGPSEASSWRWNMQEYFCNWYPKHLRDCYKQEEVYNVLIHCLEKYKENLEMGGDFDKTYNAENIFEHIKENFKGQPILSTLSGPLDRTVHEPVTRPPRGFRDHVAKVFGRRR